MRGARRIPARATPLVSPDGHCERRWGANGAPIHKPGVPQAQTASGMVELGASDRKPEPVQAIAGAGLALAGTWHCAQARAPLLPQLHINSTRSPTMAMRSSAERTTLSEINVTPLVDVMLVLLIVFMVTAPLIQHEGIKVALPQVRASPQATAEDALTLSVDLNQRIYLGQTEIPITELETKLKHNAKIQEARAIYFQADRRIPYGVAARVLAMAERVGINNVMIVTDPLDAP